MVILFGTLIIPAVTNAYTTPVSWIRDTVAGFVRPGITTDTLRIPSLTNCDTIDTDADGDFSCGTDDGGSGTPGGSDTELQWNNAGSFDGISTATTDGTDTFFEAVHFWWKEMTNNFQILADGLSGSRTFQAPDEDGTLLLTDGLATPGNCAEFSTITTIVDAGAPCGSGGSIDGSGTTNEITYWVDSDTLGSLTTATYPSLTELSYSKGVTSAIQTQLNAKAPIASPTFTGTATIPTANFGSSSGVSATASSGTLTLTGLSGTAEDITLGLSSNNTVNVGTGTGVANWVWNNTMSLLAGNSNWLLSGASSSYFGNGSGASLRTGFGGVTSPTAKIHIGAGTTAASTAPLKLTAGTNMTTPEAGAIEFDGTDLFYTNSTPTRRTVANLAGTQTLTNKDISSSTNTYRSASDTVVGAVELATTAETNTGTDATRAVTPDGLAGSYAGTKNIGIQFTSGSSAITTGDGKAYIRVLEELNGMDIIGVAISTTAPSTSGTIDVQVARGRQSSATSAHTYSDVLSTKVTIDANEYDSKDATTAAVINTSNDDLATGDMLRVDLDSIGSGPTAVLTISIRARLP